MKYTYNQSLNANEIVLKEVKRNLQESFINIWKEQLWDDNRVSGGNKLRTYRTFKKDFAWEYYLTRVTKRSHLVALAKLRTSCHSLAIETGRYHKPSIPPECHQTYTPSNVHPAIMEVLMMNIILSLNVKNCSTSGNASMKQQGNTIHNSTTYLTGTKCVIYLKLATHLQLEK